MTYYVFPIMEMNIYKVLKSNERMKWENRFRQHKDRCGNFRRISNDIMQIHLEAIRMFIYFFFF